MDEYDAEDLGAVIRAHREAHKPRKMTQEELGTAAGYKGGAGVALSRIETGATRPSEERLAGIARALGLTAEKLKDEARQRSQTAAKGLDETREAASSQGSIKERAKRIQQEAVHRRALIQELGDALNEAHDRAYKDFLMKFVQLGADVVGAPQPDPTAVPDEEISDTGTVVRVQLKATSNMITSLLAGGLRADTALWGMTATNTVRAILVSGAPTFPRLTGRNAGVTAVLATLVAVQAVLLSINVAQRNRKQQEELKVKLTEVEQELAASRPGFDALVERLPQVTEVLDYIAVHAGHALTRWQRHLGTPPHEWDTLATKDKQQYQDFIDVAAAQLALGTINFDDFMTSRGEDQDNLLRLSDEILTQARTTVEAHV